MTELLFAAVAAATFWLWHDSMRARELTLITCRRACRQVSAQLLDETVALEQLRLARNRHGRLVIARRYRFEFSLEGDDRRAGWVRLLGAEIQILQMDHPDGSTLIP